MKFGKVEGLVITFSIIRDEFHYVLFFFNSYCVEFFVDSCAKFSVIRLVRCFSLVFP